MVGWQPNYSNPDFLRMEKEFRKRRRSKRMLIRRICCIVYIIITIAIMILIPVGAYWLKNHDFTPVQPTFHENIIQEDIIRFS